MNKATFHFDEVEISNIKHHVHTKCYRTRSNVIAPWPGRLPVLTLSDWSLRRSHFKGSLSRLSPQKVALFYIGHLFHHGCLTLCIRPFKGRDFCSTRDKYQLIWNIGSGPNGMFERAIESDQSLICTVLPCSDRDTNGCHLSYIYCPQRD